MGKYRPYFLFLRWLSRKLTQFIAPCISKMLDAKITTLFIISTRILDSSSFTRICHGLTEYH